MKIINKKQCPYCGGVDVSDTGKKWSSVENMGPNGEVKKQDISINTPRYKCNSNNCKREFKLIEEKQVNKNL